MLFEKIEEKKALSATSDSDEDFDEIVAFCSDELVQKGVSLDNHRHFPL
jgi:hypothetical protein